MALTDDQINAEFADPKYAGLTADQKATLLGLKNITLIISQDKSFVENEMMKRGLWLKIEMVAISTDPATDTPIPELGGASLRAVANTVKTFFSGNIPTLAGDDHTLQAMEFAFKEANVYGDDDIAWFTGLFTKTISRAEQMGGDGTVVTAARIRALELQPKRADLATLQNQARNGYGAVTQQIGDLFLALDGGADVTLPTWADLVTTYQSATADSGPVGP